MNQRGILGKDGEDVAAAHLQSRGYRVLERNFRCDAGEIDIIAERDGALVFCEVKTRRTDRWGQPSEAVHPRKQARIRRLAAAWLGASGRRAHSIRFDVVSVVVEPGASRLEHIEDAF